MLQQILDKAGEDGAKPPPCAILKQWLPSWIRFSIRIGLIPFIWLDVFAQWVARKIIRPPYKKIGNCKKRGNCCHYILIKKSKGFSSKLDLFWHTQVNGFFKRDNILYEVDGMKVHLMGCRYLKKNGRCSIYAFRPMVCRTWPRIEYFGYPQILKGCGYKAIPY